jgi:hypothetical protein
VGALPTEFWYIIVLLASATLIYRQFSGRQPEIEVPVQMDEGRETAVANAYDYGRVLLRLPPGVVGERERPDFLITWAVSELRDGNAIVPFGELSAKERDLAGIAFDAVTLDKNGAKKLVKRLSGVRKALFENVRSLASEDDVRETHALLIASRAGESVRPYAAYVEAAHTAAKSTDLSKPFKSVEEGLLEWLPGNSDPDLWHLLVSNLNYDYKETLEIIRWIVNQPDCDGATAALALSMISPDDSMYFENRDECGEFEAISRDICRCVCERSEAGQYSNFELDDPDGQTVGVLGMMKEVAAEIEASGKKLPWPLPVKLFSVPLKGRGAHSERYIVNDDTLYLK